MSDQKRRPDETPGEWAQRVSVGTSNWKEKNQWYIENRYWLRISQNIALQILGFIKEKGISKEEFKNSLELSEDDFKTILGGKYNFDLQTIGKIQIFLGETLVFVPSGKVCRFCDTNPITYGETICIPCTKEIEK